MNKDKNKEIAKKVKKTYVTYLGSDGITIGHTVVYEFPTSREVKPPINI